MIYYNAWDKTCKAPFGALQVLEKVKFNIKCTSISEAYFLYNDKSLKMDKCADGFCLETSFPECGLVFYNFLLVSDQGIKIYLNNSGKGVAIFSFNKETPFQLTIYENKIKTPDWYKEGIAYQIFPDRFNIGNNIIKSKTDVYYYDNWYDTPKYIKNGNEIAKWDFFGGNIQGIIDKLPYLKQLNVSVIYLNPIFESCSNHRYNTADYKKIDSLLGTEEDFDRLLDTAESLGIKIILDGVFNHTGADSVYFNKFGKYTSIGAYQSTSSPYYDWFMFDNYPTEYKSWWGVMDLPTVNKENESFRNYIISDEDSVIKKWTNKKIGGWRLDVADELSDSFLQELYSTVKSFGDDKIVMGEVWEDASNKVAYDTLKSYFTKGELDSVMNYPFRDNMVRFIKGEISAFDLKNIFSTLMENYPKERFMGNFNFLGTHDIERILTVVSDVNCDNAINILKMLVYALFFFPGLPCIYYGDEAGVTGYKDPDNRKTYPWGNENKEIFNLYKEASDLRANSNILKQGETVFLAENQDVFCITRLLDGKEFKLYINRSNKKYSWDDNTISPYGILIKQ